MHTTAPSRAIVKTQDIAPELKVRAILEDLGIRYRTQRSDLPGTPDFVVPAAHLVLFVHGCFWHAHSCRVKPKLNARYWAEKQARNSARDARVKEELRRQGWDVLVLWECDIECARLTLSAAVLS